MDVDRGGQFKSLRNIEVFQSKRGDGMAEKIVGSIMASLPETAKLHINDILPTATGFWDKMGAKFARSEDFMEAYLGTFMFVMILFFTLLLYGIATMRGILEEKSSRVMEVLLGSVSQQCVHHARCPVVIVPHPRS